MVEPDCLNPCAIQPIKFICSYGGHILPRYPDGKLRYHGGETRLLTFDRSISFSQLVAKLGGMCGTAVNLRCQLPVEDLDALVSITSDEDLVNLIEEYDITAAALPCLKIRAFLSVPKTLGKSLYSASPRSNGSMSPILSRHPFSTNGRCVGNASKPPLYPCAGGKAAWKTPVKHAYQFQHHDGNSGGPVYVIHNRSHWQ